VIVDAAQAAASFQHDRMHHSYEECAQYRREGKTVAVMIRIVGK
jgi:hypothetical protein